VASFKDKLGREWALDLTVGDLKAVRRATGVEFTVGGGVTLFDQIGRLAGDPELLGRAVWELVKDQAAEKGVEYDSFEKGLDRDTVKGSALALVDAFLDFYHPPAAAAAMREAVRGAMDKTEALIGRRVAETLEGAVEAFDPLSHLSRSAGSTPASPGSTPGA
jgi:hypothetical protein